MLTTPSGHLDFSLVFELVLLTPLAQQVQYLSTCRKLPMQLLPVAMASGLRAELEREPIWSLLKDERTLKPSVPNV